jgi:peroxiredoxin
LLDFQVSAELLRKLDIQVVAASVDSLEQAQKTVQALNLSFPIGYGLDAKAVSALTGAFYEDSPRHLHATGFLVSPSGKIFNSVYASRSIGRLTAQDVVSLVEIVRSREKQ